MGLDVARGAAVWRPGFSKGFLKAAFGCRVEDLGIRFSDLVGTACQPQTLKR